MSRAPTCDWPAVLRAGKAEGLNACQIASKIGAHERSVRRAAKRHGIELPKRAQRAALTPEERERVRALYHETHASLAEIAQLFGCAQALISKIALETGQPVRSRFGRNYTP